MTTVAFDGLSLSVDTQITDTFSSTGHSKVHRFSNGSIGAFCGDWAACQKAMRFLEGTEEEPEGVWACIVIYASGVVRVIDNEGCTLDVTGKQYALGSGGPYALGAMLAGKTAAEAVAIAAVLDPNTGLPIETITVSEVVAAATETIKPKARRKRKKDG